MTLENDNIFNELFDEEFGKIPFIFRFSKIRYYGTLIATGLSFISIIVFIVLFYNSGSYEVFDTAPNSGYQMGVNIYNYAFGVGVLISAAVLGALGLWMVAAKWFEQRAFKKASNLAQMIRLSEESRNRIKWMNWKAENRFDF